MTTHTIPADVEAYLRAVRARLDDLPAEEREDLLADVEPSVVESAEEADAPVAQRLGSPERFADDLRAAAGLPPRADAVAGTAPKLYDRLRELDDRLTNTQWLRELAALWWVVRAVVAVGLLLEIIGFDQSIEAFFESGKGWLAAPLLMLAVAGSVVLGVRRPRRTALVVALNVALLIATFPIARNARDAVESELYDYGAQTVVAPAPEAAAPARERAKP